MTKSRAQKKRQPTPAAKRSGDVAKRLVELHARSSDDDKAVIDEVVELLRQADDGVERYNELAKLAMETSETRALSVSFVAHQGKIRLVICDPRGSEERTGRLVQTFMRAALETMGLDLDEEAKEES